MRSTFFHIGLREVPFELPSRHSSPLFSVFSVRHRHRRGGQGEAVNPPRSTPRPQRRRSSPPPPPFLHLPRQQPLEAQADGGGGGTFHFPKSERRRAVICQFGLNGEDSGLNVVFPPGCAIQTSRGGRGTQGAGCNARVKLEL